MNLHRHRDKLKYILITLLAVFLLVNRGARSLIRNCLEYRRLEKQKLALELERDRLEKNLRAGKEPGRVEESARKELGMARAGEIEYRFAPPESRNKETIK